MHLSKTRFRVFFQPVQFGVACRAGTKKIVHSLRNCIEEHWMQDKDFVIFKVDMTNAFNFVSRQAVLDECSVFPPEILPWVSWCYGSHPELWHPMGHLSSKSSVIPSRNLVSWHVFGDISKQDLEAGSSLDEDGRQTRPGWRVEGFLHFHEI